MAENDRDPLIAFAASQQPRIVGDGFATEDEAREHAQRRGYADGLAARPHNWWTDVPSGWGAAYYDWYHDAYADGAKDRQS